MRARDSEAPFAPSASPSGISGPPRHSRIDAAAAGGSPLGGAARSGARTSGQPVGLVPFDPRLRRDALIVLAVPVPLLIVLILMAHSLGGSFGAGPGNAFGGLLGRGFDGLKSFGSSGSGGSGGGFPAYGGIYATAGPAPEFSAPPSAVPYESTPPDPTFDSATDTASTPVSADDPATVVENYFAAITNRDYQTAWSLGGENLGESYDSFVSGFAHTAQDQVTIVSVDGDVVTASLLAVNQDQSTQSFSGTYTVTGGVITNFAVQQTG